MYTFNKHLTIQANIAVAHGVAVFAAHAQGLIGAPDRIRCKTRGKLGSVEVSVLSTGKYLVQATGSNTLEMVHANAVDAMMHFTGLVGAKNAQLAVEAVAKDRTDGGTNHCTIEALLDATPTTHLSKTFLKSSRHPRGAWCYAVRLGVGQSSDGIKRANDTVAYGGCCIHDTYGAALVTYTQHATETAKAS